MNKIFAYLISFFILFIVATLPSNAMRSIQTPWYKCIRSDITPPNYVFPIVWTTLYTFLAIVLAQIFLYDPKQANKQQQKSWLLLLFAVNLILNILWSFVYFQYKNQPLAYLILLSIIGSTLAILYYTYQTLPLWVFYLIVPYYLWTCFALVLSTVSLFKKC